MTLPLLYLDAARSLMSLGFLAVSAWSDWRTREVNDSLWLAFGGAGLALTLLEGFLSPGDGSLAALAVSSLVGAGLGLALYYTGLFGGADAKALICLSLALPKYPSAISPLLGVTFSAFPVTILNNSAVTSALIIIPIFGRNLAWKMRGDGALFEGLEGESPLRKLVVLLTAYKLSKDEVRRTPHLYVLQDAVRTSSGQMRPRLKIGIRAEEPVKPPLEDLPGQIWVSPALPFLVFMTIGLLIALLMGDVVLATVLYIIGAR